MNTPDILRLRILLCFLRNTDTIMTISRALEEEHYVISRAITAMEKEGLVVRTGSRKLALTESGKTQAKRYAERINVTMNHLLYEGVHLDNARNDAYFWALYNSDETMAVIRSAEELCRVKYELRECGSFTGATLCKMLADGEYKFPFIVYREKAKNGNNISMANNGFEHPCILSVHGGTGTLQLTATNLSANSGLTGVQMRGHISRLTYFKNGEYIAADQNGRGLFIPADVLLFQTIGSGIGQVLHGQVCMKMQCSVGKVHMPEGTAIFTLLV